MAVAPDGAVYIADWYDASVGGHQMKDIGRGRIYRLAPVGYKPAPVTVDLRTMPVWRRRCGRPRNRCAIWRTPGCKRAR